MKNILIVGGSKGIGEQVLNELITENNVINLSRSVPSQFNPNLSNYNIDILRDELPDLEQLDAIVYCPGSINLKPISRLSLQDFRDDFEINVIGAIKTIQKYLPLLKKSTNSSVVLFSTVATKLGMPYHASVSASKSALSSRARV